MSGVLTQLLSQSQYRGRLKVLAVFLPLAVSTVYFDAPWLLAMTLVAACMDEYQSIHPVYSGLLYPRAKTCPDVHVTSSTLGKASPRARKQEWNLVATASSPASPTFRSIVEATAPQAPHFSIDAVPIYQFVPLLPRWFHVIASALLCGTAWFGYRAFATAFTWFELCLILFYTLRTGNSSSTPGFHPFTFYSLAYDALGYFLTSFLLGHALLFHPHPYSTRLILLVITCVIAGENGAMVVGKLYGRHRPWPQLSPKKTSAGAVAQVVTCAAYSVLAAMLWTFGLSLTDHALFGTAIGVMSTIGDLVESFLKRCFGLKDIGTLLPGTGGMWDRVDGQIFAFVTAYYYLVWCTDYGAKFPAN